MGNLVQQVVDHSGLSVVELASVSGIPKSNIYRYLSGQAEPTVDVLRELAMGAQLSLNLQVAPLSEGEASRAARSFLGELDIPNHPETDQWIERIQRGSPTDADLVVRAGQAANPLWRKGARYFRGGPTTLAIASAGDISGGKWALSGAPVLEALGLAEVPVPTLLWCERPDESAQALSSSMREVPQPDGAQVIVLPAIHSELEGARAVEGIWLVSVLQGLLDLAGLGAIPASLVYDFLIIKN